MPQAAGNEYEAYSLTSARLYADYPTDGQRNNVDAGHLDEALTWALVNYEGSGSAEYLLAFDPIVDDDPNSSTEYEKYFVALNYKNSATGADVQDVEQIFVWRPRGATSKIRVSARDVYDLDDEIQHLAPNQLWTEGKINAAIQELVARLKGRRYVKERLFNWEELNPAAVRLAAAYCYYALTGEGNQFLFEKARMWEEKANALFEIAQLGYDSDGDGTPDAKEVVQTGGAVAYLR